MLPIVPQLIKADFMEKILSLGFIPSASVSEIKNTENWEFCIKENRTATNILYVIVFWSEDESEKVAYIGHSRKTLEDRLYGYKLGHGKSVNNRVHKAIKSHLNNYGSISVYCLPNTHQMTLQNIPVDLAAGLEYGLIAFYAAYNKEYNHPPLLNIAGNPDWRQTNESTQDEEEALRQERAENYEVNPPPPSGIDIKAVETFTITLTEKTYWPVCMLNIIKQLDGYFGQHGGTVDVRLLGIAIPQVLIQATINRTANQNGTPRLLFQSKNGTAYRQWKENYHSVGDVIKISILEKNYISII